jgi:hypothetical protein
MHPLAAEHERQPPAIIANKAAPLAALAQQKGG